MIDNRLVVHHVGGRGGIRGFTVLPAFEKDYINVMYDADESCLSDMVEYSKTQPSKTIVLPYCIAANDGGCTFHLSYDPHGCSIYPPNSRYDQFYSPYPAVGSWPRNDYVLGDILRTMKEVQLPTDTLDAVVLERGEAPSPDFLSLDTEGSELDVLKGASRLLSTSILAVHSEVELHPFHEGQPLFGDICKFLAQYNFDFVEFQPFPKWLPIRGKHGFRGEGYVANGEALFLKRPASVETSARGSQLNKLAFIATMLQQFEWAQQCFETPGFEVMTPLQSEDTDQQPRYLDFISRLAGAVALLPQHMVPIYSDVVSYTQSKARFQIGAAQPQPQSQSQSLLRKFVKSVPPLISSVRALRILFKKYARWRLKYKVYPDSPVEKLFLEFGMKDQYLLAKRNRIQDSEIA